MLELMRHSQYTTNPLNPPYQGDFEDFAPVEIINVSLFLVFTIVVIQSSDSHVLRIFFNMSQVIFASFKLLVST